MKNFIKSLYIKHTKFYGKKSIKFEIQKQNTLLNNTNRKPLQK